jgi:hypothetical protein
MAFVAPLVTGALAWSLRRRRNLSAYHRSAFVASIGYSGVMVTLDLCWMLLGREQLRQAEVYEFPNGFRGWAVVIWDVPGYPKLPIDQGKLVERFPANGIIITSTKQQFGFAHDESFFLDSSGHRLALHPNTPFGAVGGIKQANRSMDYFQIFAGTEADLRAAPIQAPQVEKLFSDLYPATNTHSP